MTGYGKSSVTAAGRKLTIEIRTLNSKQLDLNIRIPVFLKDKEPDLRNLISQQLERGKVDLVITAESSDSTEEFSVNHDLAKNYHSALKRLSTELGEPMPGDLLSLIVKMPDVLQGTTGEIPAGEYEKVRKAVADAAGQADFFRAQEGAVLEADMLRHVHAILQLLDAIEPHEKGRIGEVREKFLRDFNRFSEDLQQIVPDQNRFEQELIYFLEKLDITEEKVRLLKHCQYFLETMSETQPQGKKLGFVTQEMGREINTIGSKASHAEIQKIVVQMKDELEKIREQLGNIL